ncbi:MAG: ParB/RepB/Spo0J family partition protein [Ktedonobacteraceae bacterium]|nr:ParB/RepB/Spo0J family partition protein [Ktedonobacteraceae bacterium]MBV9711536.1 ParB/RepB/Spo0J family partition protein [Ktedonobacteraceae bacterium]
MAKQKSGLGRGLDALFSGASEARASQVQAEVKEVVPEVLLESIIPNPRQPRRAFREDDPRLLELSASIKEHGLIQPLIVMRLDSPPQNTDTTVGSSWLAEDDQPYTTGREGGASNAVQYQIIAGERRWRAARLAGLIKVPVVIKDVTPQQMLEMALIENIQRADLNPIEEALAYQALIQEFGLTQEMVAKQVGKDRSTITNSLRLLQLAPKVRDALINLPENFSEGHARALVGIAREEDQVTAMNQIVTLRLNVRQAEELAARIKASQDIETAVKQITASPKRAPELEELETHFRDALMVKVDLKCNPKGKGTLVLHFNNQDELENLYSKLVKREGG